MITKETHEKNQVYIQPENLIPNFQGMGSSLVVTQSRFEFRTPTELKDMSWNHMDQLHRNHIHHTYQESMRLVRGSSFALSLTRVGIFKLLTLVVDIQLRPGLFYQSYTLFNIFYVHLVIEVHEEEKERWVTIDHHIVSHRLFKFFHNGLHRRLLRLNEIQNKQDTPLREQRVMLRSKGYHFKTDEPDFLNCNTVTSNVIAPRLEGVHSVSLKEISPAKLEKFSAGSVNLLVRKNGDQNFTVWTAICPHEGGPLELGKVCNGTIICPWHGLRQSGAELNSGKPQALLENLQLTLEGDELTVCQYD